MLNVLIGAAIGALVNVGAYCAIQLWRGQGISWKSVLAAGAGGIVAGALAGTTFGASLLAGSTSSAASFLAFDGAAAAGTEKMASNALDHKAWGDGVPEAAAWGAITAPATGLVLRGAGAEISKMLAEAGAQSGSTAASTAASDVAAATDATAPKVPARLPLVHHTTAPGAHAIGTVVFHAMVGSPWIGEAVKGAQAISASHPKPVAPSATTPSTTSTSSSTAPVAALPTPRAPAPRAPATPRTPAPPAHATPAPFASPSTAPGLVRGPAPSRTSGVLGALGRPVGTDN